MRQHSLTVMVIPTALTPLHRHGVFTPAKLSFLSNHVLWRLMKWREGLHCCHSSYLALRQVGDAINTLTTLTADDATAKVQPYLLYVHYTQVMK